MKATKTLLVTDELLEPVADVVKRVADRVIEVSLKREERIKRFVLAAEKTVSVRLSSSSKSTPTDISDERTNERTYLVTDSDEKECHRRKMKD